MRGARSQGFGGSDVPRFRSVHINQEPGMIVLLLYYYYPTGLPRSVTWPVLPMSIHLYSLKHEPVQLVLRRPFEDGPAFCSPCIAAHGGKEKAPFSLGKFHLYLDRLSCRRLSRGGLVSPYKTRSGYDASCQ